MEILPLLKKADIFSQMRRPELEIIARYSTFKSYNEGDVIFTEGASGEELYVVAEGRVLITRTTEDNEQRDIAVFLPGESFGELNLFENKPRNANAIAEKETTLLVFPMEGETFTDILARHEDVCARMLYKLLAMISGRIRQTNTLISDKAGWVDDLKNQIYTDKLTGVFNRTFLEEEFPVRMLDIPRVSLVMIKPDDFKKINDTWGHEAGDEVLRIMGNLLKDFIQTDDIAVRYRGDEFALLLPGKDADVAKGRASDLLNKIRLMELDHVTGGEKLNITASLGIESYPGSAGNAEELVKTAYERMWKVREDGGNDFL